MSYCLRYIGIDVYQYFILAVAKWPLFTYNTPAGTTGAETANDLSGATPDLPSAISITHAPELSAARVISELPIPPPEQRPPTPSFTPELTTPPGQSNAAPGQPGAVQLVTLDDLESDFTLTQPIVMSDESSVQLPVPTTLSVLPEANTGHSTPIPDSAHPSSYPGDEPQKTTPDRIRSRPDARPLPLGRKGTSNANSISPSNTNIVSPSNANPASNTLAGVTDEPMWMKKKHTLNYFRGTTKLGDLPSVIEHWYELERLLGFPGNVSVLEPLIVHTAHDI